MKPATHWIERLQLQPHPEGGFYRETYRSSDRLPETALPQRFPGARSACTAIYYLLEHPDVSALHRIRSDEIWHHYAGSALRLHVLRPDGGYSALIVGSTPGDAEPQAVVPAGCWFAAELAAPETYALVGCTVAPGFDFADFELATPKQLCTAYPAHRAVIERLSSQAHLA